MSNNEEYRRGYRDGFQDGIRQALTPTTPYPRNPYISGDVTCSVCGMVFEAGKAYGYYCSKGNCPVFTRITAQTR